MISLPCTAQKNVLNIYTHTHTPTCVSECVQNVSTTLVSISSDTKMGNAESLRCIFGKKKFANRNNMRNTLRNLCSWVKTGQHCPQYRIARIRRISTSMSCWKCCWHCQCPTPPRQHQHLITFHYAWRDYLQRHDKLNFLPDNGPSSYPSRLVRNYLEIHNSTHAACSRLLTQHLLSSMWRFWDEWFNSTAEKFVSFWITTCFCWKN